MRDKIEYIMAPTDNDPNRGNGEERIPVSELRELIEEWRNGTLPREGSFNQASNQLEEKLDEWNESC